MKQAITNYLKDFDREFCKQYILNHCQEEYQKIQETNQRLMDNRFLFNGNWDMEPCPHEYRLQPLNWESFFEDDPEWAYMLNRQEYLLTLLLGYLVEGKVAYIQQLKYFILHWIEHVPTLHPQSLTTRTLDTGIRCFTWLKCLLFLIHFEVIHDTELETICQSMTKQIQFMKASYLDKYTLSNWGILQTIPIIACYYFLSDRLDIEEEYQFSIQELEQQIQVQILEDGTQFEQSILYHVEVYKALLELSILIPEKAIVLKPLLKKMAYYIEMMTGLDGKTIAVGDSDTSATQDILTLSALFLKDETLCAKSSTIDLQTILLLGRKGIEQWKRWKTQPLLPKSHFFNDSGHVCIKSPSSYFFFKNGPMGSAHTHSDQNSFCLQYQGQPIFIDSGRYSYKDSKERIFLKSALGHTGCIIDQTPPEDITGSWSYNRYPQHLFCQYQTQLNNHYIEGSYQATTYAKPYLHLRKILMISDTVWFIIDDIQCQGEHTLATQFIVDPEVVAKPQQLGRLHLISDIPLKIEPTLISKRYNELVTGQKLVKTQTFSNRIIDYTIIADQDCLIKKLPVYQSDGRLVENALAFDIRHSEWNKLVLFAHDDIFKGEKLCLVDGIKMRGKVIVYDKQTGISSRLKS
ncbi:heparinase II/III family protein [Streptococcus sp. ZJ93]|uniref:heparinase II/III domain-containing protein n=1 Tax=Streptococcus handemini TaxID=3161188 RepID=UPI0034D39271